MCERVCAFACVPEPELFSLKSFTYRYLLKFPYTLVRQYGVRAHDRTHDKQIHNGMRCVKLCVQLLEALGIEKKGVRRWREEKNSTETVAATAALAATTKVRTVSLWFVQHHEYTRRGMCVCVRRAAHILILLVNII